MPDDHGTSPPREEGAGVDALSASPGDSKAGASPGASPGDAPTVPPPPAPAVLPASAQALHEAAASGPPPPPAAASAGAAKAASRAAAVAAAASTVGSGGASTGPPPPRQACAFFLKTGTCAFGDRCRFSHPYDRVQPITFNRLGLPMRPGEFVSGRGRKIRKKVHKARVCAKQRPASGVRDPAPLIAHPEDLLEGSGHTVGWWAGS